jgi:hypothetical protein
MVWQLLPVGQHSKVVFAASRSQVVLGPQQKPAGALVHGEKPVVVQVVACRSKMLCSALDRQTAVRRSRTDICIRLIATGS